MNPSSLKMHFFYCCYIFKVKSWKDDSQLDCAYDQIDGFGEKINTLPYMASQNCCFAK